MKRLLRVAGLVVVCLGAVPAQAELWLRFQIDETVMTYTAATQTATITETADSALKGALFDDAVKVDSAHITDAADFDLGMSLDFTHLGADSWKATGLLTLTDRNLLVDRLVADFVSTSIDLNGGGPVGALTIKGRLSTRAGNDAILGGSDPWKFEGTSQLGSLGNGVDGVARTLSLDNWGNWDSGDFVSLHFVTAGTDLGAFFAEDRTGGGEVDFNVVPVPAGVLLGMLGLSVAGVKLRKAV
jgi:hypothetical protein